MDESTSRWPTAWIRAALDLAILSALGQGELHGYAIAAALEARGMGRLKGGSLYPVLARLEADGLVAAVWLPGESGPGRKAYSLTPAGARHRERLAADWQDFTAALGALSPSPATEGDPR
ncbi:PadR family transcriptional regulator [Luteococcus peritonei]|uniref:PadR family transcriptional regulator n=1 Tax=Luteococcus peritonei TaxID=88874 RepID=A0ABW4RSL0_9ACTN